jgi:hypothetical protein
MAPSSMYLENIKELISANGWEKQLIVEQISENPLVQVRISLTPSHSIAPGAIVNEYSEGVHPFEQIQQECLRALRTGSPGL